MIEFDESWCMDLIGVFPSVVTFRVALPLDQILQGRAPSPGLVLPALRQSAGLALM